MIIIIIATPLDGIFKRNSRPLLAAALHLNLISFICGGVLLEKQFTIQEL